MLTETINKILLTELPTFNMSFLTSDTTNDALISVDNESHTTINIGFALRQSKLTTKKLKKDAIIDNYDTDINNYEENINLKCSSGFYLKAANPALLSLAKQSCDVSSPLAIKYVFLHCTNTRISLDSHNLLVNYTYFFEIRDRLGDVLGKVTVHCHFTSKLVQSWSEFQLQE